MNDRNRYPPSWNLDRVRRLIQHYESQSDEEAIADDEAAFEDPTITTMDIPTELVPTVRSLLADLPD